MYLCNEGGENYSDSGDCHITLKNNIFIRYNDQLIRWMLFIVPNVHEVDTDPLKIDLNNMNNKN